ncbi:MAG: RNA polymerase sigma factor [Thermoanaerobaculia bacterium]
MEPSDAQLVEKAQAGDGEAFGELVRRHSRYLFGVAYRVTGDEGLAEDVVQDAFLKAWERLDRFDFRAQFTTWIYRIAVNRAIDVLRRRGKMSEPFDATEAEARHGLVDELHPQRAAESAELTRLREAALAAMSPMERTSFVLRHMEGRSIAEIGEVLGVRSGATKHAVFRAVKKLRAALEPYLGGGREAAVG